MAGFSTTVWKPETKAPSGLEAEVEATWVQVVAEEEEEVGVVAAAVEEVGVEAVGVALVDVGAPRRELHSRSSTS